MKKYLIIGFIIFVFYVWNYLSTKEPIYNISVNRYSSESFGFSIVVPKGFTINEDYQYQINSERISSGVKFTIPESLANGTNLSSDTYLSVEKKIGSINSCAAEIYLENGTYHGSIDLGSHSYSIAKQNGAAAGNRYEEIVYATPVKDGCIAVRYFIHYSAFENYPEGTIKKFDEKELINLFDSFRETLVLYE